MPHKGYKQTEEHKKKHKGHKPISFERRFWSKVDKKGIDDCWEWIAGKTTAGYGSIGSGGNDGITLYSHRVSWEIHNGPIPEGLEVCHNCPNGDNPACVNPKHLFLGTHQQNMNDMSSKGRSRKGRFFQDYCHMGHLLSGGNLYINQDGHRYCRECHRASARKRYKEGYRKIKCR